MKTLASKLFDPRPRPSRDALLVIWFVVMSSFVLWRSFHQAPTPPDGRTYMYRDFDATVYYPVRAVVDGVNPYQSGRNDPHGYMREYPVHSHFPLYSPLILLILSPLAIPPAKVAALCYALLNLGLLWCLSWFVIRLWGRRASIPWACALTALLLLFQPTRAALQLGQIAPLLTLAMLGVIHWGDRHPGWSSLLLAIVTIKPNFGGPTAVLQAMRGSWKSAIGGVVLGGLCCLVGMGVIFSRSGELSVERVIAVVYGNQTHFEQHRDVNTQTAVGRVDTAAALEYLSRRSLGSFAPKLIGAALLLISGWVLWKTRDRNSAEHAASLRSTLMALAIFISIYHKYYDLGLLILPIGASVAACHPSWQRLTANRRYWIAGLLSVPFLNVFVLQFSQTHLPNLTERWLETEAVGEQLIRYAGAANGLALTVAWGLVGISLWACRRATPVAKTIQPCEAALATTT